MQSPNFRNNNKIHHDSFELFAPVDNHHHHHQNTTTNMSIDRSMINAAGAGASVHSSVSSNSCNSHTRILDHPGLKPFDSNFTGNSAIHATSGGGRPSSSSSSSSSNDDVLARMLMDPNRPTIPLGSYYDGAWAINLKKLHVGAAFAQGAFGKLYRGAYNGEDVAIKLLEKPEGDPGRARLMEQQFGQEVMMLAGLRHRNIVTFVGACRKETVWCIVTEYARGGSVRQALAGRSSGRAVPVRTAVKQALDVARGMEYVHGLGFIHRDLKSDNLLIFGDKSIKIADFGVARIEVKTEGMTPETGTYRWMAPEMIQHRPYNQKVDVYSFGIVLWELITGMLPFQNMTAVQAAFAVVNKGARPNIPNDCPPVLRDLMTRCWDANPDVRPSFTEVVKTLEHAQQMIGVHVGKARFRCCMVEPMTTD